MYKKANLNMNDALEPWQNSLIYQSNKGSFTDKCKVALQKSERKRKSTLKRIYSLTPDQVNAKLKEQDNKCDICKQPLTYAQVNVDHDHVSGNLRGLLCKQCNWMLGNARDNVNTLINAVKYLRKYRGHVPYPEHRSASTTASDNIRIDFTFSDRDIEYETLEAWRKGLFDGKDGPHGGI